MKLYFSPLATSMATRISLYEAGVPATFVEVDTRARRTHDGGDYTPIHPLGMVPTLLTDGGELLLENIAILLHVAESHPEAGLIPVDPVERSRLHRWLAFVGTEIHKAIFFEWFDRSAPDAVKAHAVERCGPRFAFLEQHLAEREFLLDRFSVADAYLVTLLNTCPATPIKLSQWPVLKAYYARLRERPSVAKAISEELPLYLAAQARLQAAR
ncbi:glutathione binding-like protein [Myxococcus sp. K15C18031901]|uniref:glutathione S-transferase family protein n=1 Tax=Myxococcus dinghuensis TaxID=2906761 RepID=UPI0020A7E7DE|nr:glutathione binding-like protein [Myxococcus dinghuensis]MCP3100773.1 glutathione binding-like protein [Myxococcus dinghuensis]